MHRIAFTIFGLVLGTAFGIFAAQKNLPIAYAYDVPWSDLILYGLGYGGLLGALIGGIVDACRAAYAMDRKHPNPWDDEQTLGPGVSRVNPDDAHPQAGAHHPPPHIYRNQTHRDAWRD